MYKQVIKCLMYLDVNIYDKDSVLIAAQNPTTGYFHIQAETQWTPSSNNKRQKTKQRDKSGSLNDDEIKRAYVLIWSFWTHAFKDPRSSPDLGLETTCINNL